MSFQVSFNVLSVKQIDMYFVNNQYFDLHIFDDLNLVDQDGRMFRRNLYSSLESNNKKEDRQNNIIRSHSCHIASAKDTSLLSKVIRNLIFKYPIFRR